MPSATQVAQDIMRLPLLLLSHDNVLPSATQVAQDIVRLPLLLLLLLLLLSLPVAGDCSLTTDSILKTCDMVKVVMD